MNVQKHFRRGVFIYNAVEYKPLHPRIDFIEISDSDSVSQRDNIKVT